MLILANGAVKSGSTWLFHIARELTGFAPPPARYANPKWTSTPVYSIDQTLLACFLADEEARAADCLSKNHFSSRYERDLLLADPLVRVLNIRRDVRDVLVSAFYHGRTDQAMPGDFAAYYWTGGRQLAQRVLDYQIIWAVRSSGYCCLTYETLLTDFACEVARLGRFLGLKPDPAEIERIRQATSPAALCARYPFSDFNRFRRGQAGDWQNHFDDAMAADMALLIRRSRHPLHRLALGRPGWIRRLCRPWRNLI